jgi:acyl-CoA synthetase (AMP-forming)/AMP-acid ligase II
MLLHDTLDYNAREQPAKEFATQGARRVSYAEAQRLANRMAHALVARGLVPGDRIGLLSKNSIEHAPWYYACSKCGVVPVPLNYRLAPPEWSFIEALPRNPSGKVLKRELRERYWTRHQRRVS